LTVSTLLVKVTLSMPDTQLHVAYLINQYPQPSHTFIRREIAALENQGVGVHRFTLRASCGKLVDPGDQAEYEKTRAILDQGPVKVILVLMQSLITRPVRFLAAAKLTWKFSRASNRGTIAHLAYFAEACVLRRWLIDAGVTHLHAHFGTNSTAVASICRELGGPPFSFTVHGPEEFDNPVGLSLGEKTRRAAFAVTISAFGRSQLCRWCEPEVWPRIQVVRCGVDQSFLVAENPEKAPAAAELASPAEPLHVENSKTGTDPVFFQAAENVKTGTDPVFLPGPEKPTSEASNTVDFAIAKFVCVGRLEPQKGQLLLLDAVAKMMSSASPPNIKVTLIGEGSMRDQLERRIRELGLADMIYLAGLRSGAEIREEILASRAMVLPSFAEGLPVVLMESLALATPVITTWVAGIPELVDAACGWLVPAGDTDALANALRQAAMADQLKLRRMGQVGRARVLEKHDSATEAAKLRYLFRGLST
jgi:glycosyltransferase involved in cell wall biosynthesis